MLGFIELCSNDLIIDWVLGLGPNSPRTVGPLVTQCSGFDNVKIRFPVDVDDDDDTDADANLKSRRRLIVDREKNTSPKKMQDSAF